MDDNVKKFYPPVIEGTIPAFYGTTLVVPFSMNRAVGKNDIRGFSLKIKTIQTNTFVANIKTENYTTKTGGSLRQSCAPDEKAKLKCGCVIAAKSMTRIFLMSKYD